MYRHLSQNRLEGGWWIKSFIPKGNNYMIYSKCDLCVYLSVRSLNIRSCIKGQIMIVQNAYSITKSDSTQGPSQAERSAFMVQKTWTKMRGILLTFVGSEMLCLHVTWPSCRKLKVENVAPIFQPGFLAHNFKWVSHLFSLAIWQPALKNDLFDVISFIIGRWSPSAPMQKQYSASRL